MPNASWFNQLFTRFVFASRITVFCVALKLQRAVFKVAGDGGHFRDTITIELMLELMTFGDRKVNVDFEDEIFRRHEQEIVLKIDDLE